MIEGEVEINYWVVDGTEAEKYRWGCSSLRSAPPFLVPVNGLGKGLLRELEWGFGRLCSRRAVSSPAALSRAGFPSPLPDRGHRQFRTFPAAKIRPLKPPSSRIACLGTEGCIPIPNPVLNKSQSAPKIVAKWETGLIFFLVIV